MPLSAQEEVRTTQHFLQPSSRERKEDARAVSIQLRRWVAVSAKQQMQEDSGA